MAFKNEKLTPEVIQILNDKYNYARWKGWRQGRFAVDEARNAWFMERMEQPLLDIGGKHFALIWNECVVEVDFDYFYSKPSIQTSRYINRIVVPYSLEARAEELIELIMDAIECVEPDMPEPVPHGYTRVFEYIDQPQFVDDTTKIFKRLTR